MGDVKSSGAGAALKCEVRGCERQADFYPVVELSADNGRAVRCVVGAPTCAFCKGGIHSLDKVLGTGGGRRFFQTMQRTFQSWYRYENGSGRPPTQLTGRRLAWCRVDSPEAEEYRKMREGSAGDVPEDSVHVGVPKEVHRA
jgi:hypothetical protein